MNRRTFLTVAAAAPMAGTLPLDLSKIPTRKFGKAEIVFKSPGDDPKPNGLQATSDGLWIIDQGTGNKAHLVSYNGKVLRSFETETDRSSGITFDGETLWVGSTYIVKSCASTPTQVGRSNVISHPARASFIRWWVTRRRAAARSRAQTCRGRNPGRQSRSEDSRRARFRDQWRQEPVRTDRNGGMENFGSPSRLPGPYIAWIRRRGWFKPSSPLRETVRMASDGKANISGSRIRI
jgi:hypothetical protein